MQTLKSMVLAVLMLALLIGAQSTTEAAANWDGGNIRAEGLGIAPPNTVSYAQARALARRAAITDAYRQLAEQIQGVSVDATTTVENMMVTNNTIRTHVSALIRGAQIVEEKSNRDGSYTVTLELPIYGAGSLASGIFTPNRTPDAWTAPDSVYTPYRPQNYDTTGNGTYDRGNRRIDRPKNTGKTTAPAPLVPAPSNSSAAAAPTGKAIGGYTGVIIDCRGLGLRPVMSPVIKTENGRPIYGYKNLDSDKVVANGMAAYARSESEATRAGKNPLRLRAIAVDGGANPVLSSEDARRLLLENGASGFLDATNVVFIR